MNDLTAEDETDRRIVIGCRHQIIHHAHIAVHLADIRVGQLADLEINEQVKFQTAVVENEVDVAYLLLDADEFLPGDKCEAAA